MAVSVADSGSQTATVNTEHTLSTQTSAGIYLLAVDLANLAAGDVLELRIYGKARSGDTERLLHFYTLSHAQTKTLAESIAVPTPHHFKATLKQVAGTGRAFPWAVYAL